MTVQDVHNLSLATSTALSRYYVPQFIAPLEVTGILDEAGVYCVLVGTHGLGGWMRKPRTTVDVDVLVTVGGYRTAVAALRAAFPRLEAEKQARNTRLQFPGAGSVAVDVMKPSEPLLRAVLKSSLPVESDGQAYRIPSLEAALVLKFAPLMSSSREQEDKYQDAHDFLCILGANPRIDLVKLAELGDLVYNGGGKEVVELVRKVRAGEKLRF
jgi:hypothetical protein